MPTTKNRINVTVPDDVSVILNKMAERDGVSLSAKVLELTLASLEIEEDAALNKIAEERLAIGNDAEWVSHEEAWL